MALDHFDKPNHALLTGMLWGALMRAGIDAHPEADADGDFTDVMVMTFPEMVVRVRVLPQEPPGEHV